MIESVSYKQKIAWIGFILVLAGCSVPQSPQAITQDGTIPLTAVTLPPAASMTVPPTPFARSSATSTAVASLTAIASTALATLTPLPTLPPDDAMKMTIQLLRDNAGCRLPCWWGITPGQTSWSSAEGLLKHLGSSIELQSNSSTQFTADVLLFAPGNPKPVSLNHKYIVHAGIVEGVSIYNYDLAPQYYFTELLKSYGPPDEVWIRTYRNDFQGNLPFGTALFYSKLGIMAEYYPAGQIDGKLIRGCPQQGTAPFLGVWAPSVFNTFAEANKELGAYVQDWQFLSIEEATGMTVHSFYEEFQDPSNDHCLETPADLWPSQ